MDLPPGERARRIFKVRNRQRIERWSKIPKNNKEWTDLFNDMLDFESDWGSTFWNEYQKKLQRKYLELKEKENRNNCH